jgi:hypothetical protein
VDIAAIFHFLEMNDFDLSGNSKKKIKRFVPSDESTHDERAYTKEEIARILSKCDERSMVIILLGLHKYENGYSFIKDRDKRFGEELKDKAPLIREQFNIGDRLHIQNPGFLSEPDWATSTMIGRSIGIGVAWGDTSKFGVVITQKRNNKVEVFYVKSFEKPLMNNIINHISKVFVDGANPEVTRELKMRTDDVAPYFERIDEQNLWNMRTGDMQIIPVNFQKRHKEMLRWTHTLMAKRLIKIHPSLHKLYPSRIPEVSSSDR